MTQQQEPSNATLKAILDRVEATTLRTEIALTLHVAKDETQAQKFEHRLTRLEGFGGFGLLISAALGGFAAWAQVFKPPA